MKQCINQFYIFILEMKLTDNSTHELSKQTRVWSIPPEPMYLFFFLSIIYSLIVHEQYIYYRSCNLIAGDSCNYSLIKQNLSCQESIEENEIQKYASYLRLTSSVVTLPTLLVCIIFGPLSDYIGRKFIFYLPIIGLMASNAIYLIIEILNLHPYALLIANAVFGFSGGGAIFFTAVEAYTVDVTSYKYRTFRLGIAHTALSFASFLGNFTGGIFIEKVGFLYCFLIIILLLITTLLYTMAIPESIVRFEAENKRPTARQLLTKISKPFRIICSNKSPFKFVTLLLACEFLLGNIFANYSIFTLYALSMPLCWMPHFVGWFFAFTSLGYTIGIYLFLPLIIKFQVSDYFVIMAAAIDNIVTYTLIGTFHSKLILLVVVPIVGCLNVISGPSGKSALSKLIDSREVGSLFGLTSTMGVLTNIIVSSLYNAIYPSLRVYYVGLCFYLIAGTSMIPLLLSGCLYINSKLSGKRNMDSETEANGKVREIGNESEVLIASSYAVT